MASQDYKVVFEKLETLLPELHGQVQIGINKLEKIQQEEKVVKQQEAEINANENFTYKANKGRFRKIPLELGSCTTSCLKCNYTCHENCCQLNDQDKKGCWAMDDKGYCRECPGKCYWSVHINVPYRIEYYQVTETCTYDDMKMRYDTAKRLKQSAKDIIAKNEKELIAMQVEVCKVIGQIQQCIKRLEEMDKSGEHTELYKRTRRISTKEKGKAWWELFQSGGICP